jgi:enoyl-CoA hydratase
MADRSIRVDMQDGTAIVRLNRPPANAIDIEFAAQLEGAMEELEKSAEVRAIVLTGTGACFSAGLDLKLIPSYDRAQQRSMVTGFNRLVLRLYGMGKPLIGALNGHTVAGGLVLALCCDHRIAAAGPYTYGLTEARVGIPFPVAAITVVTAELNAAAARALVLLGSKSGPETLLAQGVVDRIKPAGELLPAASAVARDAARMPHGSYARIKRQLRGASLARMEEVIAGDNDPCLQDWLSPETAAAAARILAGRDDG